MDLFPTTSPRAKLPPAPRRIRRRKESELSLVLVVLMLAGSACFTGYIVGRELIYWYVETNGHAVIATIDDKDARIQSSKGGSHHNYYLRYDYTYSGQQVFAEQRVPLPAYNATKIGEEIPAHFQRIGSWDLSKLEIPRADGNWGFALIVGCIFGTISIVTAVSTTRKRRLVREGVPAAGEITDLRVYRGKSTSYYARYRFTTDDGNRHWRRQKVRSSVYETLSIGTPVTVLYDPANPKRSLAYECCDYEVVPALG